MIIKNYYQNVTGLCGGGDFFPPINRNEDHKQVIRDIGYLVTGTIGDYELAKEWYGAKGEHIFNTINYPSNLYKELQKHKKVKNIINILVGNSATISNNHIEILKFLSKYRYKNIKIYAPLSYGDKDYANKIKKFGKSIFKEKFIPLDKFIPLLDYDRFLSTIDIAVFNHIRQQGAGNTYTLLSCKTKIYLNRKSNLYKTLDKFNIITYDTRKINLSLNNEEIRERNRIIAKKNFSNDSLVNSINLYIKHNSTIHYKE